MHKRIHRISVLILAIIFVINMTLPTFADSENTGRTVRVACGMNDALYLDENGDPQGIGLTYLRQLAWNNNWTLKYVEGSYNESLEKLCNGEIDLMFPIGENDDPDNKLAYSDFIGGYQQIGLFAKKDADIFYDDYDGFRNKRVGLSIGSNSELMDDYAQKHDFTYEKVSLNTTKDKIDALDNGDVDMIAFSTLNSVPSGKLVAILQQIPFYFCTSINNTDIIEEINSGMSEAMVNTPDIVSSLYNDAMKGNNAISYTKAENETIKNADTITFGVYSDRMPLAGVDKDGKCKGIYVDILKEISAESGLKIDIKPIKDSNELYENIDNKTVDLVIGIQELRFYQKNADNHLCSNHVTDSTTVAVTMYGQELDAAETPTIALTKDRVYLENNIYGWFPSAKIKYYDTRKECLIAVQNSSADATFLNSWEFNYECKNSRFQNMMEWDNYRIQSGIVLGGSRQSDLEILSILEKAISQLPADKINDIITTNLNIKYEDYDLADRFYEIENGLIVAVIIILIIVICLAMYMRAKRKYIQRLEIANKTKSDFLSRMSHELRTPLNAINGYVDLTMTDIENNGEDKNTLLENMKAIRKASDYQLEIITDILDIQRMETGKITLQPSEVSPKEIKQNIVSMLRPVAAEKNIKFSYKTISGAGSNYIIDRVRVQQVLFNILYNSIKFTPEGGQVTLSFEQLESDENTAVIQYKVTDNGIGMSKEFLENRLFEKFAQENQDITSPYAGCGTGLAICKELVDLMDGEIKCDSEQGKGTTFTITLKVSYCKRTRTRQTETPATTTDLMGVRVLMCEDNPTNQQIEKQMLEKCGCIVDTADNGKIGCDLFENSEVGFYKVVLMDIRMPEMDGLKAAETIRKMNRNDAKTIPIFAVSANAYEEDVKKSLDAGMNEHLAKPMDIRVLSQKIKEYCHLPN